MKTSSSTLLHFLLLLGFISSCTTTPEISKSRVDLSCWPVKPLSVGNNIHGSFVYADHVAGSSETNRIVAWDVSSFQTRALSLSKPLHIDNVMLISPDGKTIASRSGNDLLLVSPDGERSFPLPNENTESKAYLSNGNILLVDRHSFQEVSAGNIEFVATYFILDPETGETTRHTVSLPNLSSNWNGDVVLQYSPDLKFLLYRSTSDENNIQFTLYDLENQRVVWVGPARDSGLGNNSFSIPAWKGNSRELTAMYDSENNTNYYSISLEGKVSPLTSLKLSFFQSTYSWNTPWSYYAAVPNWSPNGRYLVSSGYQEADSSKNSSMYIWDNTEKVSYKPCLPKEEQRRTTSFFTHWSYVDGAQFTVSMGFALPKTDNTEPSQISKSYILDLDNKIIYELPDEENRGKFTTLFDEGNNALLGWVNWELP